MISRNNVHLAGEGPAAMVFAHGFGCDQNMWRLVEPAFRNRFRTVLFDHVGAGGSDLAAYDPEKYASLEGYADDLVEMGSVLGAGLDDGVCPLNNELRACETQHSVSLTGHILRQQRQRGDGRPRMHLDLSC